MHPDKVDRKRIRRLTDLPNIGPAMAADLVLLGISRPADLAGRDPLAMYTELCVRTGQRQDPCVLDVFISIVRFMQGEQARAWWAFTGERKRMLEQATSPQ